LERRCQELFRPVVEKAAASELVVVSKHLKSLNEDWEGPDVNQEIRLFLRVPKFSKRRILRLCILSWYLPEVTRWELQESLRSKMKETNLLQMGSYLHSKQLCLFKLYLEDDLTHNDLFGNLLVKNYKVREPNSNKIRFIEVREEVFLYLWTRPKPKKKEFKRGYNDHGSLADTSETARRDAVNWQLQSEMAWENSLRKANREITFQNNIQTDLIRNLRCVDFCP